MPNPIYLSPGETPIIPLFPGILAAKYLVES